MRLGKCRSLNYRHRSSLSYALLHLQCAGHAGWSLNNSLLKMEIHPSHALREDGLVSTVGMTLSGHSKVLWNFWNHGKRLQHPAQSLCVEHSPEAGNTCYSEKNRNGVTFHLSKTALRCTIGCLMPWNNSRLRAWEARSLYSPVLNLAAGVASPRGNASLLPERAASHTAIDQDCDWPVICLPLYKTESSRTEPTKHQ